MQTSELYSRINSVFSDLQFEERRHLYSIVRQGKLIYLPSVSSLVKSHVPKFDVEKMLPFSAKKENTTVHELRRKWQLTNQTACDLGHKTHSFLERYTGLEAPSTPQEEAGIKFIRSLEGKYRVNVREFRAYSEKYLFAGTMDLPLEVIEGTDLVIADYKTNGDLFKAYDYLYEPFSYLESSPYNQYQLQLSYYQILLEDVGFRISGRKLVHLRADSTFIVHDTWDFTNELRKVLSAKRVIIAA